MESVRIAALMMAVLSLMGTSQGGEATPDWEAVAVQVLEETPEKAAQTLLDWAETGQTLPEAEVRSFLEERTETAVSSAAFTTVLDAAEDHFWCNTQAQRFDRLWPVE